MKRAKRLAVISAMVAGTIGLLLCIASFAGLWYAKSSLIRLGTGTVEPLASVITIGQQALANVANGMTAAAVQLDRFHQKAVQISGSADRKQAAEALLQEMVAAGLVEKARSVGEALQTAQQLQQAMVSIDQALRQILPAGAMSSAVEAGMLAGITPVLSRLQTVLAELDSMAMQMAAGRTPLDSDLLAGRIGTAQALVQRIGIPVKENQARVALAMAELMTIKSKIAWYINMGCLAACLVMVWLAFAHGCVLYWGASKLRAAR